MEQRKRNRLPDYDYSAPGAYFITICTKGKECTLGTVVGGGALDAPRVQMTEFGRITQKDIESTNRIPNVSVDKYVIMPNHIHIVIFVNQQGPSKAPAPTDALIPHLVSTLKRFIHRDAKMEIFQRSYYDHVIRNREDYLRIWQYVDTNPAKWESDTYYNV